MFVAWIRGNMFVAWIRGDVCCMDTWRCLLYGYVAMFVVWIRGDMFVAWILGYIQIRPPCTINWLYLRSSGIKLMRITYVFN